MLKTLHNALLLWMWKSFWKLIRKFQHKSFCAFRIFVEHIGSTTNWTLNKWCLSNTRSLLFTAHGMDTIREIITHPAVLVSATIWPSAQTALQSNHRRCHWIRVNPKKKTSNIFFIEFIYLFLCRGHFFLF